MKTTPLRIALILGLGIALAPAVFGMFTRAPKGGTMLANFQPYMNAPTIARFRGYLSEIAATDREVESRARPFAAGRLGMNASAFDSAFPGLAAFHKEWPGIQGDMSDLLARMQRNLDNYRAVKALPPFALFPWFFVVPGLIVAALGWGALRAARRGTPSRRATVGLVVMGIGLIAAPAMFRMFSRAPLGGEMINDFKPMMTAERVAGVQRSFLTLADAEGTLRTQLAPRFERDGGLTAQAFAARFPAATMFASNWQRMSNDMAPMVGAMSDNLPNFAAVAAMPPFPLFPWFFVIPGLMVTACAIAARRHEVPVMRMSLSGATAGAPSPEARR